MKISSKLNELKPSDLNCNVFDVYSYGGLSMQDLLCQFFTKINECIKVSNETIDLASWLVNEGLEIEVVKKLMLWLEDGTLENLINVNLFNTLNTKIENMNTQLEHIENNQEKELDKYKIKQVELLSKFKEKVKKREEGLIICQGDSITFGEDLYSVDKRDYSTDTTHTDNCGTTTIASMTYPEALRNGIMYSLNCAAIKVKKRAAGGATTLSSYNHFTQNPNADLHILMFGHNDSYYGEGDLLQNFINNYIKLIKRIIDWGSAVKLLIPPSMKEYSGSLDVFKNSMYRIANLFNCPIYNVDEFLNGYTNKDIHITVNDEIVDGVHFNGKGYQLIGYNLVNKILCDKEIDVRNNDIILADSYKGYTSEDKCLRLTNQSKMLGVGDSYKNGICTNIKQNGNILFNINALEENLCLVPIFYCEANCLLSVTNNFNVSTKRYPISDKYAEIDFKNTIHFNGVSQTSIEGYKISDINKKILRLYKGNNVIKVDNVSSSSTENACNLYGFYVLNIDDIENDAISISSLSADIGVEFNINKINNNTFFKGVIFNMNSLSYNTNIAKINNAKYLNNSTLTPCVIRDSNWKTTSGIVRFDKEQGMIILNSNNDLNGLTSPYAVYINAMI